MTSEERQAYIRAVVIAIYNDEPESARVPTGEWGVIASWMDRGIPLATVLQTIEQMDKHPSVMYVRDAVEIEEERRLRALG